MLHRRAVGWPRTRWYLFRSERSPEGLSLVWVRFDFWTDALRLWEDQSFGARPAPLSHVEPVARVLSAGAPPRPPRHLPSRVGTGHTRGWDLLDPDRRPETPHIGCAAPVPRHRRTDAAAATTAFSPFGRSHGKTARVWFGAWRLRSGCRPYLQRCVSNGP